MTFRDICKKQVVQTTNGTCLGKVDDLVMDETGRYIQAFVLYGAPKMFGLLGREPDLMIPIDKVKMFGVDVLLVETDQQKPQPQQPNWKNWWKELFAAE